MMSYLHIMARKRRQRKAYRLTQSDIDFDTVAYAQSELPKGSTRSGRSLITTASFQLPSVT